MSDMGNGCRKIRALLEGYFEGVLPPRQERMVAAHLWQCPSCTAEMEQIRRLTMALEALPRMEPAEQLVRVISDRIASLPVAAQRRNVRAGWRRLGLAAGMAMAALMLVGYVGGHYVPALGAAVGRLWSYLGLGLAKVELAWQALAPLGPAVKSLAAALLDALHAVAPRVAMYAAIEIAILVTITLLIRRGHVRAATSS